MRLLAACYEAPLAAVCVSSSTEADKLFTHMGQCCYLIALYVSCAFLRLSRLRQNISTMQGYWREDQKRQYLNKLVVLF